ncbi:hypothetical protein JQ554_03505 [Bradyrhizobium diazoefficiens]|nr:hypothetical protein [Bradyrhizobium diazoefficiens]UCF53486.1 MAG: hypothetical protein JSV48_03230 [Bradyrhizobium sp.]MBR0963161.1 hypothetical protein [Bradyrhizobium diazoefficiens]MBR0975975.1 hypothetical protein [Bradyrhizobium diazoefficiens]MBR1006824.1 hypothetical protein [Bradyrhizobium diazoefficiens]MBR1012934.1 hypothetical protein [Bradyrhizobium diazoefficiens]
MSDRIAEAIAAYQACTTPEFVEAALDAIKDRDYAPLITAGSVRLSAAMALHDVLAEEIAR